MLLGPTLTDRIKANGFDIWHTGGGCRAWGKTTGAESYLMITGEDGIAPLPETDNDTILVGYYADADDEGTCLEMKADALREWLATDCPVTQFV
jgi:hypothetical protein